eukprot:432457_1
MDGDEEVALSDTNVCGFMSIVDTLLTRFPQELRAKYEFIADLHVKIVAKLNTDLTESIDSDYLTKVEAACENLSSYTTFVADMKNKIEVNGVTNWTDQQTLSNWKDAVNTVPAVKTLAHMKYVTLMEKTSLDASESDPLGVLLKLASNMYEPSVDADVETKNTVKDMFQKKAVDILIATLEKQNRDVFVCLHDLDKVLKSMKEAYAVFKSPAVSTVDYANLEGLYNGIVGTYQI